ncbi:MAG: hypothetical protein HYW34_00095 [Candidatus Brennerbacteria bacterium]|nr:hypothetical protein [Candidatus Brennerbacteria bacterium]
MQKYTWIRKVYLYTFALVGLVLIVIGAVRLIGLALKTYIFTKADIYYQYPATRPVKAPPPDAIVNSEKTEFQEPSKEEIEVYESNQRSSQRQREAAEALAFIIVGAPLYWYHWRIVKKDKEENNA